MLATDGTHNKIDNIVCLASCCSSSHFAAVELVGLLVRASLAALAVLHPTRFCFAKARAKGKVFDLHNTVANTGSSAFNMLYITIIVV